MADEQKAQPQMIIGEFLKLAKDLYEMRAPLGAPLLLIDEAAAAGEAEPFVVVPGDEPVPTSLMPEAAAGALCLHVRRRTSLIAADGKPLVLA